MSDLQEEAGEAAQSRGNQPKPSGGDCQVLTHITNKSLSDQIEVTMLGLSIPCLGMIKELPMLGLSIPCLGMIKELC